MLDYVLIVGSYLGVKTSMTCRYWNDNPGAEIARGEAHPFRGLGSADDIALVAVFLASEDARWVTGTAISADGGYVCQ